MQTIKAIIVCSLDALRDQLVRMRGHQPTLDYVHRRTAESKSKPEIIRCLKRYVAREIFKYLCIKPAMTDAAATNS